MIGYHIKDRKYRIVNNDKVVKKLMKKLTLIIENEKANIKKQIKHLNLERKIF